MSRYFDANVTLETLKEFLIKTAINNVGYKRDVDKVCKDIADNRLSVWMEYVPTANVKPVVKGEWVEVIDIGFHGWRCSLCGEDSYRKSNYCPNCGAKMSTQSNAFSTH